MMYLDYGCNGRSRFTSGAAVVGARYSSACACAQRRKGTRTFEDRVDVSVGGLASPDSIRAVIQGTNTSFLVNVGPEIPKRDRVAATICK
jgi:hypothetical protein